MGDLVNLFVSYARRDTKYLDALRKHLAGLSEWEGRADIWHDSAIDPGAQWNDEISAALDNAQIVVFLISPDLLASQFVRTVELATALRRLEARLCDIVPIRIRDVDLSGTPFQDLQWIPSRAPIGVPSNDRAWVEVSKAIRCAVVRQEQLGVPRRTEANPIAPRAKLTCLSPDKTSVENGPDPKRAGKTAKELTGTATILQFPHRGLPNQTQLPDRDDAGLGGTLRPRDIGLLLAGVNLNPSERWSVDSLRLAPLRRELQRSLTSSDGLPPRLVHCLSDLVRQIDILSADLPQRHRSAAAVRASAQRDIVIAIAESAPL